MIKPAPGLRLPPQNPPVSREPATAQGRDSAPGIEPAQTACDGLTGLARQMCYATEYGTNV